MRFWFRVPTWYKYTVLVSYTFVAMMVLEKPLPVSGLGLSVYVLLAIGAFVIFRMWNSMIGVDTQNRLVMIGRKEIPIEDIYEVEFGIFNMSILVKLRNGSGIVFPYPIEDRENFKKLVEDLIGMRKMEG